MELPAVERWVEYDVMGGGGAKRGPIRPRVVILSRTVILMVYVHFSTGMSPNLIQNNNP